MATLSGTWVFNETIGEDDIYHFDEDITFSSNGSTYSKITIYSDNNITLNGMFYDDTRVINTNSSSQLWFDDWVNEAYRTITFDGTKIVDALFYEWFIANAKPMVTSLTGYTVTVPSGWSDTGVSTLFNIKGYLDDNPTNSFDEIGLGYSFDADKKLKIESFGSISFYLSDFVLNSYSFDTPNNSFKFTVSGGADATNPSLIQWLYDNNATFENTSEETQTLTVVNSNNPIETVTFTMPKGYTFEQFIGSAYDTSGGKFVISNKYTVEYESNKLLQEDTDNAYDITVASGTFYYKGEAAQSGIWYNGSLIVTIKEGQTVTLHTNGKKAKTDIVIKNVGAVDEEDTQTYTLRGTWVFNKTLTRVVPQPITFTSAGKVFNYFGGMNGGTELHYNGPELGSHDDEVVYLDASNNGKGWYDEKWRTVDFGSTPQAVSQEFYEWFIANVQAPIKFTIADVTYGADNDMIWEDWVNSKYNTGGFMMMGRNVGKGGSYYVRGWTQYSSNIERVLDNDPIQSNYPYVLSFEANSSND